MTMASCQLTQVVLWALITLRCTKLMQRKTPSKLMPALLNQREMMNRGCLDYWILIVLCFVIAASGQQSYEQNAQLNCNSDNTPDITYGYTCNGQQQTCQAYAIYRAQTGYQTLANISTLLNSNKSQMAQINKLSDTQILDIDKAVIAPINCSCAGNYSQANTSYVVQPKDSYFSMANNTYQGLSTCQAMMQQNSVPATELQIGMSLQVPLRCACPTNAQVGQGFKYLLSYLVRTNDFPEAIAIQYGATVQQLFDANGLTSDSKTIYPYTTVLVPLRTEPTGSPAPSPPPPAPTSFPSPPTKGGSKAGLRVGLGVGIAAAVAVVMAVTIGCILFRRKRTSRRCPEHPSSEPRKPEFAAKKGAAKALPADLAVGIQEMGQTLPRYKLKDLEAATANFNPANRIAGSVYRGVIDETPVAVKQIQGDVSQQIGILQKLNHSNLVHLWGFCVTESRSYLVFEYADNGSLADYLQSNSVPVLSWRQRLEIVLDVANGLDYLHNFAVPSYVHKDIKSSNVLLDGNFRAKIANFGLAKSAGEGFAVTRHVVGTKGYMAPEYLGQGLVTPKLDVFAFGVVMLELLSGKPAVFRGNGDVNQEVMLWTTIGALVEGSNPKEKFKGFMDSALKDEYPLDMALAMAELAMACVNEDFNRRASINEIQMTLSSWLSDSSHSHDLESVDSDSNSSNFKIKRVFCKSEQNRGNSA